MGASASAEPPGLEPLPWQRGAWRVSFAPEHGWRDSFKARGGGGGGRGDQRAPSAHLRVLAQVCGARFDLIWHPMMWRMEHSST